MNKAKEILEFGKIINKLKDNAVSEETKKQLEQLEMILDEKQLASKMKETTEARGMLDHIGMPPLSSMKGMERIIQQTEVGSMLEIEQLSEVVSFLKAIRQMIRYLARGEYLEYELAYYGRGFYKIEGLEEEIERCIRNGEVDSEASPALRSIRRSIEQKKEMIKAKLEKIIQAKKSYLADSYIISRNGHYALAVKKEYQSQIEGYSVDTSRSGGTVFIEPAIIGKMQEELALLEIQEENEVRRILYTLTGEVEKHLSSIKADQEMMLALDMAFAKGKLSVEMKARPVSFTTERKIVINQGRHPLLPSESCIPLDFEIGEGICGIIITGPNTGGKTVALKTIGLLSMMAQCGLHVPVGEGCTFTMNNQILCDIGDGQSIEQNLSTFSAHIKSITEILNSVTKETLVLLDELGSGTDPKEGMGIAISILEMLRVKTGLFVATTHYPEVKDYALETKGLQNACMQFDKETLMPLYTLKIGEAGESCALYIAEKLGFPKVLIELAKSYIGSDEKKVEGMRATSKGKHIEEFTKAIKQTSGQPKLKKVSVKKEGRKSKFQRGDSVMIFPEKVKGIVFMTENEEGQIGVQVQGRKRLVGAKRLKLLVSASQLYPDDYDFSIIFDTVANRKAKHKMKTAYREGMRAEYASIEEAKWNSEE